MLVIDKFVKRRLLKKLEFRLYELKMEKITNANQISSIKIDGKIEAYGQIKKMIDEEF